MMRVRGIGLLTVLMILLSGCGGVDGDYRTDVSPGDLADHIAGTLSAGDGMTDPGEGYITGSMGLAELPDGAWAVRINTVGTAIDEFGVLRAGDGVGAGDLKTAAEDYLDRRLDSWMPEYLPEELPKLEGAEIRAFGDYVVYGILDGAELETLFAEAEAYLSA